MNNPELPKDRIIFPAGVYEGEVFDKQPHGVGKYTDQSGFITGTWINGFMDGEYIFTSNNG